MLSLCFASHKSCQWIHNESVYFRGFFHFNNRYYTALEAIEFLDAIEDETHFHNIVKKLNGNFAIIINKMGMNLFSSDRICSYPLYYTQDTDGGFIVSDSMELLREKRNIITIDTVSAKEYLACGYVIHRKTMYSGIFRLQAGEYAVADKHENTLRLVDFHLHRHSEPIDVSYQALLDELDEVVVRTFQRLIVSLKGRPVVLFLSGGYDSRLILVNLRRLGYDNVICVAIGKPGDIEWDCAKVVAQELGYPLLSVEANQNTVRKKFLDGQMDELFLRASEQTGVPYLQGYLLDDFLKEGIIPTDSVVLTGNSGDVVEGWDVCLNFADGNTYTREQLISEIVEQHFFLQGKKFSHQQVIRDSISTVLAGSGTYTCEQAQDMFEYFNWRERQAKYVVQDARNYDNYLGVDWRLPLWDHEFVDFWLKVPLKYRFRRKLYFDYVKHEAFPTANNPSLKRKIINYTKKHCPYLIELLYLPSKLSQYKKITVVNSLFGLLTNNEYKAMIYRTRGYKTLMGTANILKTFELCFEKYSDGMNSFWNV